MKSPIVLFLLCLIPCVVSAQVNDAQKAYEEFRKKALQQYDDFRKKTNADYAEFVKQAWKKYEMRPAVPQPKEEPVPPVVQPEEDKDKPIEDKEKVVVEVVPSVSPQPQPVPVEPIKEQPEEDEVYMSFVFFGTEGKVRWDETMRFRVVGVKEDAISKGWVVLSDARYDKLINDCLKLRKKHALCDWAYLQMLRCMSDAVCGAGTNEATLLMAYVYCQSGYKMRLALSNGHLCMFFASEHCIYGERFLFIDNDLFYPFGKVGADVYICNVKFPKEQSLSLQIPYQMQLAWADGDIQTRKSKRYSDFEFQVACNKNLMDFYNTYPASQINGNVMTCWAMYANTPMDKDIADNLYPVLKAKIAGLSQKDAVERLLNWVQTAFEYEYDDTVWGRERAFFPEETLYYPYADCEDRSILLTRLVRDLLGLKCILIYYPNHLASAVCFDENVNGDYFLLSGSKFVVCDPTFIGGNVGETMSGMDNGAAKVILLD